MSDEFRVWVSSRKCKKKTSYHLRWIDFATGKWRSKSAGTDRRYAEREAARLEDELDHGTHRDVRHVRWDKFSREHVASLPGRVNAAEAERTLRMFAGVCAPLGPHTVTYSMIEQFDRHLRDRGNSTATRNKRLRYLRAAFNKARKRQHMKLSPMADWAWEREDQKRPRVLTADEKAKLLAACPTDQWRAFVVVALISGCRRGELLALAWDRVDFDNAQIVITGTKGKRDRIQPLGQDAIAALRGLQVQTLRDGGPFVSMRRTNVANRFSEIVRTAGIVRCTIHDLRRTFCTDLARLGVNQLVVQELAGHQAAATTAKYYQWVDDPMKREAISKLQQSAG